MKAFKLSHPPILIPGKLFFLLEDLASHYESCWIYQHSSGVPDGPLNLYDPTIEWIAYFKASVGHRQTIFSKE